MKAVYDYIIVGGGSAGCILANRLSENPQNKVCLLEAGPQDKSFLIHMPAGFLALVAFNKQYNWRFESEPEPGLNNRKIFVPRGKTLGGSSSINGMVAIRGHKEDYDEWESLGNTGWSFKDLLPIFKTIEGYEGGGDTFHGVDGPLKVSTSNYANPMCEVFLKAAEQQGYQRTTDFNGAEQEGIGLFDVNVHKGKRCSSATAFLNPVRNRPNLDIVTNTLVEKILFEGAEAVGVQVKQNGERHSIKCRNEVVLAAGAINTPQILLLSGVGAAAQLTEHNIPLVLDLPGVGENLQEHWHVGKIDKSSKTIAYGASFSFLFRNLLAPFDYIFRKKGLLTSTFVEAGGFIKSKVNLSRPDFQFHFNAAHAEDSGRKNALGHSYTLHTCLLRAKSRGWVRLRDKNPKSTPKIQYNFMQDPNDEEQMITAFKITQKIMNEKVFDEYRQSNTSPSKDLVEDEEIIEHIRANVDTVYHPVGTCKMGQDAMSVVDEMLRVKGLQKIRIADASIMPLITGGNTNIPTMVIAYKAADMILESQTS
jgi:choline dehydrogenase-like flavoprotein